MSVLREGSGTRWILSGAAGVLVFMGLMLAAVLALSLGQPSPALATHSTDAKQTADDASVDPDDICKEGITGEWHFVINQVDEQETPPASIQVMFDDGHTYTVFLDQGTGSPTAKYTFTTHLTNTLLEATAVIYHGWEEGKGQFVVSHTPCAPTVTATTPTPTPTPTVLAATPAPTPPPTAVLPVELPPTGGGPVGGENSFASLALLLVAAALMLGGSTMAVALSRKRPS